MGNSLTEEEIEEIQSGPEEEEEIPLQYLWRMGDIAMH